MVLDTVLTTLGLHLERAEQVQQPYLYKGLIGQLLGLTQLCVGLGERLELGGSQNEAPHVRIVSSSLFASLPGQDGQVLKNLLHRAFKGSLGHRFGDLSGISPPRSQSRAQPSILSGIQPGFEHQL